MKNIYLVSLVIIALAVFILGMAIFIAQKRNPQTANPQTEITQPQTEGIGGGALAARELSPEELRQLEQEATGTPENPPDLRDLGSTPETLP